MSEITPPKTQNPMNHPTLGENPATQEGALKIIDPMTRPTVIATTSRSDKHRRGRPVSALAVAAASASAASAAAAAVSTRSHSQSLYAHQTRRRDDDVTQLTGQR